MYYLLLKILLCLKQIFFSHVSGVTVLAVPADIYSYGASYWLSTLAISITGMVTIFIYLPVFYKLQLTSSYEYLKLRFDNRIRTLASFLFVFSMTLYLPIVIYIPALAFAQGNAIILSFLNSSNHFKHGCIICIFSSP